MPEPAQPAAKPAPIQDKTERLDDVIAKLRQHPSVDPAAALAPERPPERRVEPVPEPVRAKESVPAARPSPSGRKLVVYGEPAPRAAPTPLPARPSAAPPQSPDAAGTKGQRSRWIGIAAIVAAIVVLFALILWALIAVVRGAPRSGRAASPETVAEARSDPSIPKSE